eukprot:s3497_g5.t1
MDEAVETLRRQAQIALGVGKGRLVDSSGVVLDDSAVIVDSGVRNGDSLALHVNRVQASATAGAFAVILGDGSVVTWGAPNFGGDSSSVQGQLRNVQHIQATGRAFAALLGDGSVVTWGGPDFRHHGGDSTAVQDQLKNVQQIQASARAFAAIVVDRSVVTWGWADFGGNSSAVQDQLRNVLQIQGSTGAFAAILEDGSVVTWGDAEFGGDSSAVQAQLQNVQHIESSSGAFAAILDDGSVVTWGDARRGGDNSSVQAQLKNVLQIQACGGAFAAIRDDGSVVTWGANRGGDSSAVQAQLQNVLQIQASDGAFAAILRDGSVVTWGDAAHGGDSSAVQDQLRDVQHIKGTLGAFAAVLGDGTVMTWGEAGRGGDSSAVQDQLKNVQHIQASAASFAAILGDGAAGSAKFAQASSADAGPAGKVVLDLKALAQALHDPVVAVDLLFNHDRLDMEVSEAFRRSVYHPAWKRLRYYSDSNAPEARSPAKSWRLQDRTLERQFSLSCYFTEAATRELEISRMQDPFIPYMQRTSRGLLFEAGVKATDDPVSNALVAWVAHSLRVQRGAEELVHLSRGRPFGYAIGKPEVSEWLLPVFVEHDRSSHAERMALLAVGKLVKSAGAKLHPDSSVSGMVGVYATHTPCISCMAVFCQFKQKLPGVKLYVCFDKWGETNRWIAEEVRALPQEAEENDQDDA